MIVAETDRTNKGGLIVRSILAIAVICTLGLVSVRAADDDTPAAKATFKLLEKKITFKTKDTRLEDAIEELKEKVPGLKVRLDSKGGVSRNQQVSVDVKDATLAEVLDKMFMKNGLGYIVITKKNDAYDGSILVKQGKERGRPLNP